MTEFHSEVYLSGRKQGREHPRSTWKYNGMNSEDLDWVAGH
jgi:hypothetical protein